MIGSFKRLEFSSQKMIDLLSVLYFNRGGLINMHIGKLYILSKLLTIIGALNWGLVGLLDFDLVAAIFGKKSFASRLVYTLVGLAGVYLIVIYKVKCLVAMKHHVIPESKRDS
jgi:uncharacterized membrane protein YuzA (DUF378 family)